MADGFTIRVEADLVHVVFAEPVSLVSIQLFFSQVPDEARNADISKILCDARDVTGQLDTLQRFQYGSRIAEKFQGLKAAFVLNESLIDPNRFGEKTAVSLGGNIRVFTTLAEGYRWLDVKRTKGAPIAG
ncbi:hypothetical protein DSCW_33870 [Desulfosarcina widdelii]|uniref:Uncharacterized protein n=1 Tax=Desulfosarcina widdelii TaxID=947919 RepID=A0A5K7Z5H0_9BACT|nr:hypothetical protein [Desulfosarcina widdelii]BBO75970.1 hypothetical protein DSCW_33870 [Desulfosarcina widdelii]